MTETKLRKEGYRNMNLSSGTESRTGDPKFRFLGVLHGNRQMSIQRKKWSGLNENGRHGDGESVAEGPSERDRW
jgi:hypothetical protein